MKKGGDYAELLLTGTDGDSNPRSLFPSRSMHFHILAFIGLLWLVRYMNIITGYIFYGIAG